VHHATPTLPAAVDQLLTANDCLFDFETSAELQPCLNEAHDVTKNFFDEVIRKVRSGLRSDSARDLYTLRSILLHTIVFRKLQAGTPPSKADAEESGAESGDSFFMVCASP
jgi:hypothetical protein